MHQHWVYFSTWEKKKESLICAALGSKGLTETSKPMSSSLLMQTWCWQALWTANPKLWERHTPHPNWIWEIQLMEHGLKHYCRFLRRGYDSCCWDFQLRAGCALQRAAWSLRLGGGGRREVIGGSNLKDQLEQTAFQIRIKIYIFFFLHYDPANKHNTHMKTGYSDCLTREEAQRLTSSISGVLWH